MDIVDLRRRVGAILAAEEKEPPDWVAVDRLADELSQQLISDPDTECPEIVDHYLDDADVRAKDEAYGAHQRQQVRRFIETGEYRDSKPVPLWAFIMVLAVLIALALLFLQ